MILLEELYTNMKRIQDEEIMALYILNEFLNIDISNFKKVKVQTG